MYPHIYFDVTLDLLGNTIHTHTYTRHEQSNIVAVLCALWNCCSQTEDLDIDDLTPIATKMGNSSSTTPL